MSGQMPQLHVVDQPGVIDRDRAILAVEDLLSALGRDVTTPNLSETPRRVADAWIELLSPSEFSLTTFPNDEGYDELVVVRDIPFHSVCEHHLLPFTGVAHIGYLPGERILGLSKFARVLDYVARDLQVQERLTAHVADLLWDRLAARGVGVAIEAEHSCMSLRGALAAGTRTLTLAMRGVLHDDDSARAQFLNRIQPV